MGELQLQQLWEKYACQLSGTKTLDGQSLQIYHAGHQNHISGPDFELGHIVLQGNHWFGSIEIHLKEEDWYTHRHHLDPAYEPCILHVVAIPSPTQRRAKRADGSEIPTLVLPSDWLKDLEVLDSESAFDAFSKHYLIHQRLLRKSKELYNYQPDFAEGHFAQTNWLLANAFFTSSNALPAYHFLSYWHQKSPIQRYLDMPSLLDGSLIGAIFDRLDFSWKLGYRWMNPTQKLIWVSTHLEALQAGFHQGNPNLCFKSFSAWIKSLGSINGTQSKIKPFNLGKDSIISAFVNGYIPSIYYQGYSSGLPFQSLMERILVLYASAPPEHNHKIRRSGLVFKNSLDTQAYLEYLKITRPDFTHNALFGELAA